MDLYEHLVQLDTKDSIQSKDSIIDIGDYHASGRGDRKITMCIYDNVLRKCVTHISNRNKMLLPPGIKNEGNICLASCVLHCPLNQEDFAAY